MKKDKKIEEPKPQAIQTGIDVGAEKAKYIAEMQDMVKQLQEVETEIAKRAGLINARELLLLAIAERKGIIAFLNEKGG